MIPIRFFSGYRINSFISRASMTLIVSALLCIVLFIVGAIVLYFFGRLSLDRIRQNLEGTAEADVFNGKIKTSGCILLTVAAGGLMYYSVHLWKQNVSESYDKL